MNKKPNKAETDSFLEANFISAPSPEKPDQDLLSYLESEINHLRNRSQEPGWTKWAIMGSLATAFWLLLNEIEKGIFSIENISALILLLSIVYDGLSFIFDLVDDDLSNLPNNRFFLANKLGRNRLPFLLMLTRYVVVLILVFSFSQSLNLSTRILAYILNGYYVLVYLILLVLSFLKLPIPSQLKEQNWLLKLFSNLAVFTMFILLTTQFILLTMHLNAALSITDFRIVGLIFGIFALFYLFAKMSVSSPLLNSLIEIRRNLALGRMTAIDATKQIDIALAGLKTSDVLQDAISNYMASVEEFNSEVQITLSGFNALEKYYSKKSISDESKTIIAALLNSIQDHIKKGERAKLKIEVAFKDIKRRVDFISKLTKVPPNELNEVLNALNVVDEGLQEKVVIVEEKFRSIYSNLQGKK